MRSSLAGVRNMSVILGRCNFDGWRESNDHLAEMQSHANHFVPDGFRCHFGKDIAVAYGEFQTTPESSGSPFVTPSGLVVCFDGRIDNYEDLKGGLTDPPSALSGLALVATAFDECGTACLPRLIGDWALSVWNPRDRSLLLAKDFVGTRQLYFLPEPNGIAWSTLLDPLVALAGRPLVLNDEYLAGCLASFPAVEQTPFVGIEAVAPATFVRIDRKGKSVRRYWDFDAGREIRYSKDAEYEEHFREVLARSVHRCVRSLAPVTAELSGGVDSSAIVCMADRLARKSGLETLRTVSYYDDSEPDWNERPYFTLLEENRGIRGWHIDVGDGGSPLLDYEEGRLPSTPWSDMKPSAIDSSLKACLDSYGGRVLLSGLGGDEILGGVPTPLPELADLLRGIRLVRFGGQIVDWSLAQRTTVWSLAAATAKLFCPVTNASMARSGAIPSWIRPQFAKRHPDALSGFHRRLCVLGPRPSFQENLLALDGIRRQLAVQPLWSHVRHEKRYPYLNRDLLEFIYAIPRDQLVRPHQRRSLMRRSLAGIVPDAILNRRRKAVVTRRARKTFLSCPIDPFRRGEDMIADSIGVIDAGRFRSALGNAIHNLDVQIIPLLRTCALEGWLRALAREGLDQIAWPLPLGCEGPQLSVIATSHKVLSAE